MERIKKSARKRVRPGLEVLIDSEREKLKGRSAALLAHAASVTPRLQYAWDVMCCLPEFRLKVLFFSLICLRISGLI